MMSAPMTVPMTLPRPPKRLTPPMTTAAIEDSSSGSPAIDEPPEKRAVCSTPAIPAVIAGQHVDEDGEPVHGNAGAQRGLAVAADGVGVAARTGSVQDEDGDARRRWR